MACECSFDRLFPVSEDARNILLHLQSVRQRAEKSKRQFVSHLIEHSGSLAFGHEAVLVMPEPIRPFQLQIDEPVRRIPLDDLRRPTDREHPPSAVSNG